MIETIEENEENEGLRNGNVRPESKRISFLECQKGNQVNTIDNELEKLKLSDVFLPPEIGLHTGTERCKSVVGIHYYVNECVEQRKHPQAASGWRNFQYDPTQDWHNRMVIQMKTYIAQNETNKNKIIVKDNFGQTLLAK